MNKLNTNIISALNNNIDALNGIRKALLDISHPQKELNWAVGGIIVTLSSFLMSTCHQVFTNENAANSASAYDDVSKIKDEFVRFVDGMLIGMKDSE